jgi:hypothetical protein
MLRFRNRMALLDVPSDEFLNTLVQLGGYCTVAQAKRFGIANSDTRALAHLRIFEENGFLRKVAVYPVVYQVTKSATRLTAADRRARRPHQPETVLNRLLAVDFYLHARGWPAEFVFDHELKITTLTEGGCPMKVLPHRGGRPYLWERFVLWLGDGRIAVAIVDDQESSPFSQAMKFSLQFSPILRFLPASSELMIVTGSDTRERIYRRILEHADLKRGHRGVPIPVRMYRMEPSTRTFAQSDRIRNHNPERIPTKIGDDPLSGPQT